VGHLGHFYPESVYVTQGYDEEAIKNLKMTATNDFKIPVVTNTITETKTETIIKKPKGIYLGASVNSLLDPGAKVSYLDNKYLFTYQYQPVTKVHSLGISKKLF
jgi:3-deoxy-D-arabino-heptulosonate 7-phosphate (DAHP) synthase